MDTAGIIKQLNKLIQADIDLYHVYCQAIESSDNQEVKDKLREFRKDQEHRVEVLSNKVRSLGGEPPIHQDITGYMLEGYATLRGFTGTEGALQALQTAEKLSNSYYEDALSAMPAYLKGVIQDNYNNEKDHLNYIEETLRHGV